MSINYRTANVGDAKELKRLNDAFNGKDTNTLSGIEHALLREDAETVFVAETEGSLLGFLCAQLLTSICYSAFYVEIAELYVQDESRKQGIGKGMMRFAEDWYREKDIHDFALFTGSDNFGAQQFYEYMGYHRHSDILYRKRDRCAKTQEG